MSEDVELARAIVQEAEVRSAEPHELAGACCIVLASMIAKHRKDDPYSGDHLEAVFRAIRGYVEITEGDET